MYYIANMGAQILNSIPYMVHYLKITTMNQIWKAMSKEELIQLRTRTRISQVFNSMRLLVCIKESIYKVNIKIDLTWRDIISLIIFRSVLAIIDPNSLAKRLSDFVYSILQLSVVYIINELINVETHLFTWIILLFVLYVFLLPYLFLAVPPSLRVDIIVVCFHSRVYPGSSSLSQHFLWD